MPSTKVPAGIFVAVSVLSSDRLVDLLIPPKTPGLCKSTQRVPVMRCTRHAGASLRYFCRFHYLRSPLSPPRQTGAGTFLSQRDAAVSAHYEDVRFASSSILSGCSPKPHYIVRRWIVQDRVYLFCQLIIEERLLNDKCLTNAS